MVYSEDGPYIKFPHWALFVHETGTERTNTVLHAEYVFTASLGVEGSHPTVTTNKYLDSGSSPGYIVLGTVNAAGRDVALAVLEDVPIMQGPDDCQDWVIAAVWALETNGLVWPEMTAVVETIYGVSVMEVREIVAFTGDEWWVANERYRFEELTVESDGESGESDESDESEWDGIVDPILGERITGNAGEDDSEDSDDDKENESYLSYDDDQSDVDEEESGVLTDYEFVRRLLHR
jgi:hypothetical protein